MEINTELVAQLREAALQAKLDATPNDLELVQSSDVFLWRFFDDGRLAVNKALQSLQSCLAWRKQMSVDSIDTQALPTDAVYYRGRDMKNYNILYYRVNKCKRGDSQSIAMARQLTIYTLNTKFLAVEPDAADDATDTKLQKVVVMFDMEGAGIGNVDVGLLKFEIECFIDRFPGLVAYVLVYKMPWVVNAVWSIVKRMLDAETASQVLFVDQKTIPNYVALKNLPQHMGGPSGQDESIYYLQLGPTAGSDDAAAVTGGPLSPAIAAVIEETDVAAVMAQPTTPNLPAGLHVLPSQWLDFTWNAQRSLYATRIDIDNRSDEPISFKVKVTKPDRYRVKPSSGLVAPMTAFTVDVSLNKENDAAAVNADKFQVLLQAGGQLNGGSGALESPKAFAQGKGSYRQHRLQCRISLRGDAAGGRNSRADAAQLANGHARLSNGRDSFGSFSDDAAAAERLTLQCRQLEQRLARQQRYSMLLAVVTLLLALAVAGLLFVERSAARPALRAANEL